MLHHAVDVVSSMSILPSATDLADITIAIASLEANMRPPLGIGIDIPITTFNRAADVVDDTSYYPVTNINGGPSLADLGNNADNGGQGAC